MNIKDIAYKIGITRQELRHELEKMNFGIDINAKDIPDGLAMGIIRVLTPKYKDRKAELDKKEALKSSEEPLMPTATHAIQKIEIRKKVDEKDAKKEDVVRVQEDRHPDKPQVPQEEKETPQPELRPIQFRSSIVREQQRKVFEEKKKAEEKKVAEASQVREQQRVSPVKRFESTERRDRFTKNVLNVTRKIEFSDTDKEVLKKKKGKRAIAQVSNTNHKPLKRFKTAALSESDLTPEDRMAILAEENMRKTLEDESFKASQAKRRAKLERRDSLDEQIQKKDGMIEIPEVISVKEFSEKVGIAIGKLISTLLKNGILATINTNIDYETWVILSEELEIALKKEQAQHSVEDILEGNLAKLMQDEVENLLPRPPVVVVMGHVDHGKTSILDFFRNTRVVDGESGGITQHIGAYQIEKKGQLITFIDTPGHEAFTAMRARGAKITDIAILVVAADESIKAQTIEAYNHAKEAGVPIIVAINKMDKEGANVEKVKGDLMALGITPEDYGGDAMTVPVSAKKGMGMDDLLDAILLQAEVLNLKANPNRLAIATVVESHLDKSLGPVATIIVNTGTLKIGDSLAVGSIFGKVRTMIDSQGKRLRTVSPSGAVQITGFEKVPSAGDIGQVFLGEREARERASQVELLKQKDASGIGVSEIVSRIQSGKMKFLKLVVKADTQGSIEAIKQMFAKINDAEVGVKVIHSAVGGVTESDVMMAAASEGIIIGFNVATTGHVRIMAEKENVEIQMYDIIYKLMDDVKKILTGMIEAELIEIETGKAEIVKVFMTSKKKQIIGAKVNEGALVNGGAIQIVRNKEVVKKTKISNLRSFDKNVQEILAGNECGIEFHDNFEYEAGDILICTKSEKKMRTL